MNFFTSIFLLLCVAFAPPAKANLFLGLSYTMTPNLSCEKPHITVTTKVSGIFTENVVLKLPSIKDGVRYIDQIDDVRLVDSPLILRRLFDQVIITPFSARSFSLTYTIYLKKKSSTSIYDIIFRPDLIHAPGYGLFCVPHSKNQPKYLTITIKWTHIPDAWSILSSFGLERELTLKTTLQDLLSSFYMMGNLRLKEIHPGTYLSLYGQFEKPDSDLQKDILTLVTTHRSFFKDGNFPFFALSLIGDDDFKASDATALLNGVIAVIPKKIHYLESYLTFARAHFHTWLGIKIKNNPDEPLTMGWWFDGFTDYYALVLALRSGQLSLQDFLKICNSVLIDYYFSPVRDEPDKNLKSYDQADHDYFELPYLRGFALALYMNHRIRQENPQISLDHSLLSTFYAQGLFKSIFSTFELALVKNGLPSAPILIHKHITEGKVINLSDLCTTLPFEEAKKSRFDLGFDPNAVRFFNVIRNLDPESHAYKAGLREGDEIIEWEYVENDPNTPATFKTVSKSCSFLPKKPFKESYFRIKKNLTPEEEIALLVFFGVNRSQ